MSQATTQRPFMTIRKRRLLFYICLVAIPVIQTSIMYVYVNLNYFLSAFQSYNVNTGEQSFIGLGNFKLAWHNITNDIGYRYALRNSSMGFVFSLPFLFVTLFLSYYIYRKFFAGKFFLFIMFIPQIVPSIAMVILYQYMISRVMPALGLWDFLSNISTTIYAILFYTLWFGVGGNIVIYIGAMNNINDSVLEAARIDGCTHMGEFLRIVIPMIFPTISVFFITSVMGIFTNQYATYHFFSTNAPNEAYSIGYILFTRALSSASASEFPYTAALGLSFTVVAIPLTFMIRYLFKRFGPTED